MSVLQTVIITGASSGIGAEIARRFSKENFNLLLLGRDEGKLRKVQQECKPANTQILAFDLKHLSHHKQEIQEKLSSLPPPAVLVNNAGVFFQGALLETSDQVWLEQFQTNLFSAVQLTKIVWPYFLENRKGSVLNISSSLGVRPSAQTGAYSASKAAMINWTQSLAQEAGPVGIRVNCICPGIVDTPIHSFHTMPPDEKNKALARMASFQLLNFVGQTADIAEAAYFLASDQSRWTTGSNLIVDGGIGLK
jgi:NAD(P)-dependent dehydrogenase (short-subunit alcohol dehydrogenase family)